MTNKHVSDFSEDTTPTVADLLHLVVGGADRKVEVGAFLALLSGLVSTSYLNVTEKVASFTLALNDEGTYFRCNHATGLSVTVPTNETSPFAIGTSFSFEQGDVGQITFVAGTSTNESTTINTPATLLSRTQYSSVAITKVAENEWTLCGDLGS